LTKRYGSVAAVSDVSFQVARAEIFGLLGRNGAGKTTTVECLQGLRRADAGDLRVLGLDPRTQARELRRRVGCQLQESALPARIKVWEALEWFASFSGQGGDWEELIKQWGLAGKRNAHFSELSGGQRQRLFIALALVNDPQVVFLDEMTTGLDPVARHVAWGLIEAVRARGTTVVLVTHAMEEAERLCDRLGLFFTMMMLSGAGPPPEVLTGAMHWVSNLLPLTYMLRLLQDPWLGLPWSGTDTAVIAAIILGATLSARLLFRWD
jgi:ABC-2 type transport system ATP-binding protein